MRPLARRNQPVKRGNLIINRVRDCQRIGCLAEGALDGALILGKSDLALRMIDQYDDVVLVSDDRTDIAARDGALYAMAAPAIAGQLEVRGLGIIRVPFISEVRVTLAVDLVPLDAVPRMPEKQSVTFCGASVPLLHLSSFAASTPAKIRLAL